MASRCHLLVVEFENFMRWNKEECELEKNDRILKDSTVEYSNLCVCVVFLLKAGKFGEHSIERCSGILTTFKAKVQARCADPPGWVPCG